MIARLVLNLLKSRDTIAVLQQYTRQLSVNNILNDNLVTL